MASSWMLKCSPSSGASSTCSSACGGRRGGACAVAVTGFSLRSVTERETFLTGRAQHGARRRAAARAPLWLLTAAQHVRSACTARASRSESASTRPILRCVLCRCHREGSTYVRDRFAVSICLVVKTRCAHQRKYNKDTAETLQRCGRPQSTAVCSNAPAAAARAVGPSWVCGAHAGTARRHRLSNRCGRATFSCAAIQQLRTPRLIWTFTSRRGSPSLTPSQALARLQLHMLPHLRLQTHVRYLKPQADPRHWDASLQRSLWTTSRATVRWTVAEVSCLGAARACGRRAAHHVCGRHLKQPLSRTGVQAGHPGPASASPALGRALPALPWRPRSSTTTHFTPGLR